MKGSLGDRSDFLGEVMEKIQVSLQQAGKMVLQAQLLDGSVKLSRGKGSGICLDSIMPLNVMCPLSRGSLDILLCRFCGVRILPVIVGLGKLVSNIREVFIL